MEGSCGERLEHISVEEICNTFSFQDNINIHLVLKKSPILRKCKWVFRPEIHRNYYQ